MHDDIKPLCSGTFIFKTTKNDSFSLNDEVKQHSIWNQKKTQDYCTHFPLKPKHCFWFLNQSRLSYLSEAWVCARTRVHTHVFPRPEQAIKQLSILCNDQYLWIPEDLWYEAYKQAVEESRKDTKQTHNNSTILKCTCNHRNTEGTRRHGEGRSLAGCQYFLEKFIIT